jgi:hypothetical protein
MDLFGGSVVRLLDPPGHWFELDVEADRSHDNAATATLFLRWRLLGGFRRLHRQ